MIELAPSILSADFSRLGENVLATARKGVKWLHIDVMDGLFVPSISFGFPIIKSLRPVTDQFFDVHLMIQDPIRYIDEFAKAGSDGITFHLESCKDPAAVIRKIHENGCRCGISINPGTPAETVFPYLEQIDMVLIMTVEPGFGGQKYIDACTEKIETVSARIRELGLEVSVEVDGGIHEGTIRTVLEAGADRIVCGSAVFKNVIEENVEKLQRIIEEFEKKHE